MCIVLAMSCRCLVEYVCHVHARADDMVVVVISDKEYPYRVAFSLISRVSIGFCQLGQPMFC